MGDVSRRTICLVPVLAVGLLWCASFVALADLARAQDAKAAEIHIDNFAFTPAVLEIKVGTTVTWTNRDDIPHTVTEKTVAFKSRPMDTDEKYSHTFDTPGDVDYFCSLHPHMTGKIVVKP